MDSKSFKLVHYKLLETEFFLKKMDNPSLKPLEINSYFNAFASSARSITFTLQFVLSHVKGFVDWYKEKQNILREDKWARFFVDARNETQKQGKQYIHFMIAIKISKRKGGLRYFFKEGNKVFLKEDVPKLCQEYFILLVNIVHECYQKFKNDIDIEKTPVFKDTLTIDEIFKGYLRDN